MSQTELYAVIFVLGVSVGMLLDQLLDLLIRRLDRRIASYADQSGESHVE